MSTVASLRRAAALLAVPLALAALSTCSDSRLPTAAQNGEQGSAALAASGPGSAVTAAGTIPLPINQSVASSTVAFGITQTGTGPDGLFKISNTANTQIALLGQTNGSAAALKGFTTGTGNAGVLSVSNTANSASALFAQTNGSGYAVKAQATGIGSAGYFQNTSTTNGSNALYATTAGGGNAVSAANTGSGPAVFAANTGTGVAGTFIVTNTANGANAFFAQTAGSGSAGDFEKPSGSSGNSALLSRNRGSGLAGNFIINNPNSYADVIYSYTDGTGWAGEFQAASPTGKGVLIATHGGAGLQVTGGTKNAVVATTTGARALYTEESSEVWFTDYGFGKLVNGRARILFDPAFAQTVNVEEPYHVFVQAYGDAELYVPERTPLGFEVVSRDGTDRDAEFSYRIVAKRLGFEAKRLERAPWADGVAWPAAQTERD